MAMRRLVGLLCTLTLLTSTSVATHLRCGEIIVNTVSANTVEITIRVYTNTLDTHVLFGGDQDRLDFGDGQTMMVPEQINVELEELGNDVGVASFTVRHTYDSPGRYTVSYTEPNRNDAILNFDNSVGTMFYLETTFTLDAAIGEYISPQAYYRPIFFAYHDQPFSASIASEGMPGSELQYTIVTPLKGKNSQVDNYRLPDDLTIDKHTGLITWNNMFNGKFSAGEYLIAVRIDQYARINDNMMRIGSMYRDLQIILDESVEFNGTVGDNTEDDYLNVFENSSKSIRVFTEYTPGQTIEIELSTDFPEDYLTYVTYDSTTDSGPMKVTRIDLLTDPSVVRDHPYVISIRNGFESNGQRFNSDINYAVFTKEYDPIMGVERPVKRMFSPNPAQTFIQLHNLPDSRLSIEFIDLRGTRSVFLPAHQQSVDLTSLTPGLYLLRIRDPSGRIIAEDKVLKL